MDTSKLSAAAAAAVHETPFVMTEDRLERMQGSLHRKIEEMVHAQVPSKRPRFAADLDAVIALAMAVGQAPVLHTLQAAAELGFAMSGAQLLGAAPATPVVPTENN